jgi:uncharacterized metal-binding protein
MKVPKIGLLVCNSGSSSSGVSTGIAAMQVLQEFGSDMIGICSLPALANEIPRQVMIVKNLEHMIVVDGCANSCAKKVTEKLGLSYGAYINLEHDLHIKKQGPFSTLLHSDSEVKQATEAIKEWIKQIGSEL